MLHIYHLITQLFNLSNTCVTHWFCQQGSISMKHVQTSSFMAIKICHLIYYQQLTIQIKYKGRSVPTCLSRKYVPCMWFKSPLLWHFFWFCVIQYSSQLSLHLCVPFMRVLLNFISVICWSSHVTHELDFSCCI